MVVGAVGAIGTHSPKRIICCKLTPVGGNEAKWLIFFHSCGVMENLDMVDGLGEQRMEVGRGGGYVVPGWEIRCLAIVLSKTTCCA